MRRAAVAGLPPWPPPLTRGRCGNRVPATAHDRAAAGWITTAKAGAEKRNPDAEGKRQHPSTCPPPRLPVACHAKALPPVQYTRHEWPSLGGADVSLRPPPTVPPRQSVAGFATRGRHPRAPAVTARCVVPGQHVFMTNETAPTRPGLPLAPPSTTTGRSACKCQT